jgi:DNA (cytosine-5)-methyltransferase 1
MGLPEGWVTQVPGLSRTEQLKALGNGVVPAQCARAFELLAGVMTGIPVTRATRAELDELLPTPQTMDGRRRARSQDEIAAARALGGGCANLREAVFDMGGV